MKKIASISAPAKAILCGQHAVVYNEDAIAFGVDLKCYGNLWLQEQQNNQYGSIKINIKLENQIKPCEFTIDIFKKIQQLIVIKGTNTIGEEQLNQVQISFEDFTKRIDSENSIQKIVLTTLYKIALFCGIYSIDLETLETYLNKQTFILQTYAQIPIGKGLGSSASFNSVLASALMVVFGSLTPFNNLHSKKSVINDISRTFQKVQHGQPSGIDNFVSIYGGMVLFNRSKNPPFKLIDNQKILSYLSENLSIAFVDSGVQKNTKLAVSNVREKYNLHIEGNNKYKQMIEQIGTFPNKIIDILSAQNLNDQQRKSQLFLILNQNHQYLKNLDLSIKEIDEIVSRYNVQGTCVAKITGAGMGGVVLIVGEKSFLQKIISTQKRPFFLSKMNTQGLQINFEN